MSEEELSVRERFVVRMFFIGIFGFLIIAGWHLYLGFMHGQWEQGLLEYYVYYELRELSGLVALIADAFIVIGGIILIAVTWRELYDNR